MNVFEVLNWAYSTFKHDDIKLSTSFGAEGMVLIDLLCQLFKNPRIFTIDTGRNFQETYDVWNKVLEKYKINIETYYPDQNDLSKLVTEKGPNLFYKNIEDRKECCNVRKVKPLKKALAGVDLWITGLRKEQNTNRENMEILSFNETHQVYKICPILNWSEINVWEYIRNNGVVYNKLHDKGFPTVGCMPCSRPVRPIEDKRAGRWWWEEGNKECGLHFVNGVAKPLKQQQTTWNI